MKFESIFIILVDYDYQNYDVIGVFNYLPKYEDIRKHLESIGLEWIEHDSIFWINTYSNFYLTPLESHKNFTNERHLFEL